MGKRSEQILPQRRSEDGKEAYKDTQHRMLLGDFKLKQKWDSTIHLLESLKKNKTKNKNLTITDAVKNEE